LLAKWIAALALCRALFPKGAVAAVPEQTSLLLEEEVLRQLSLAQLDCVYVDTDDPQSWFDWLAAFKPNARVKVIARNKIKSGNFICSAARAFPPKRA